ncbi:MAG: acyltransferase [Saprospiraceae bacterium]|nr:acyltransferase [Saprospiraceae bacterium]
MFFVLSGFLLTFLLLSEKRDNGVINLKYFYFRRILRIWPIYYLSFFISLILMHFNIVPTPVNLFNASLLYIFMLANLAYAVDFRIRTITQHWSIGAEEQFYAIWPLLLKKTIT